MTKYELQQSNNALRLSLQRMTELALLQRDTLKRVRMHLERGETALALSLIPRR